MVLWAFLSSYNFVNFGGHSMILGKITDVYLRNVNMDCYGFTTNNNTNLDFCSFWYYFPNLELRWQIICLSVEILNIIYFEVYYYWSFCSRKIFLTMLIINHWLELKLQYKTKKPDFGYQIRGVLPMWAITYHYIVLIWLTLSLDLHMHKVL